MKKIVLIATAAIAFTTASQAQDSTMSKHKMKQGHDMKMRRPDGMSELNLTADQQEKMNKLRQDNRTKMEAIRNNSSLNEDQKAEQIKSLHQEQRKNMEALLTDEQKTKWKEMRKDQMQHHRDMKMGSDSTMKR